MKLRLLGAAAACLALTACASTQSDTSSSDSGSDASALPSATVEPASGEPIQLANISLEAGPNTAPEGRQAAEVAVKYVNEQLGGVDGRPLVLDHCVTDGSPEQSAACANKLLAKKPVAFVGSMDLGTSGSVPIIEKAGVPMFGQAAVTPEALSSPGVFNIGMNALGGVAGWSKFAAKDLGAKRIDLLAINLPASALGEAVWKSVSAANGATPGKSFLISPTASDLSAYVTGAAKDNPDAIVGAVSPQMCLPLLQAHESIAADIPLIIGSSCAAKGILDAAGSAAEGVYFGYGLHSPYDLSNPDVAVYRSALKSYDAEDIDLSEFSSNGFGAVVDLQKIMSGLDQIDTASLTKAITALSDAPGFMGQNLTCGVLPISPGTCATGQWMTTVEDGKVVNAGTSWWDGASQIKLG